MRVFLDSSALVKRYIGEAGTDEVLAWCEQATELAVAVIAGAVHAEFAGRFDALKARRESAAALEARIAEYRATTIEGLRRIGAAPIDAPLVADPVQLRAKIS